MAGAAAQPRLLALLAVVAAGGDVGVSRDRLVGVLWPETDPARSRHALAQALYHARQALERDDLFIAAGGTLRLNPACVTCDLWDADRAIASADLARVACLCEAPFLDGFHISAPAEFDQWVSGRRAHYERRVGEALEQLADAAHREGDDRRAVGLLRRRVALDPMESRPTAALIALLASCGDRAGAVQVARDHETVLRRELDLAPEPAIAELIRGLHAKALPQVAPPRSPGTAVVVPREEVLSHPGAPLRKRALAGAGMLLSLTIVSWFLRLFFGTSAPPTPGQPIVVAPFRVSGAAPALTFLRDGMVELLTTRLADEASPSVDAGSALHAWRRLSPVADADVPLDSVAGVAHRLGATHVVTGSVVGNAARAIFTATLTDVRSGRSDGGAHVEGPLDSLTSMVDRLAVALLEAQSTQGAGLARRTTQSPAALRAFLYGQGEFRRASYAAAARHLENAVALDSTFALAALQLAVAADRLNDAEQHDRAIALAWATREALSDRDAAHLVAFAGPSYPSPSPARDQLAAWQRAVTLAPDRASVWEELGELYFYNGAVLGATDWRERAAGAFRRALSLDASLATSRSLLVLLAARAGNMAEVRARATPGALRDSVGTLADFVRWRVAIAINDARELRRVQRRFTAMDQETLRLIAMSSQFDGVGVADGERAIRLLRRSASPRTAAQFDALMADHSLALNAGRPTLALDLTEQLQEFHPAYHAHLRLRVLDAVYGGGAPGPAETAAAELARLVASVPAANADQAVWLADACVLAQWRLQTSSPRGVPDLVHRLRSGGLPRTPIPVGANPHTCAALLDAWLAVQERRVSARAAVARLDSLMLSGPAAADAGTYSHVLVARLFAQLGEYDQALAAIRRRAYMTGWPRYAATARREEARLALAVGDSAGARRVLARYLALRDAPERALLAEVAETRSEWARLENVHRDESVPARGRDP